MKIEHGENKRCHLEMIQGIINRMGANSFIIKEGAIVILVATYAFVNKDQHNYALIGILPILILWILDSYYLSIERKNRALYDITRKKDEKEIDFDMNINNIVIKMEDVKKYNVINILISKSIFAFYISCIITMLLIYFIKF